MTDLQHERMLGFPEFVKTEC